MAIDLSLIKVRELPEKEDTILICGMETKVTYKPVVGEDRLKLLWMGQTDDKTVSDAMLERINVMLSAGVEMSQEDISKLIEVDWYAAVELAERVYAFTADFEDSVKVEEEKAEKNSDPEGSGHTAP